MYKIIFYRNARGEEPVLDYIKELSGKNNKDSRIKRSKIQDYLKLLSRYGTYIGEPYVKHLQGDIWELRPARDRILFAGYIDGSYIMLHCFAKKTQKTPIREIIKAKEEFEDYKERKGK